MKIKYISFIIISMVFSVAAYCQQQLYFENFESSSSGINFVINAGSLGTNHGNNKWIIDNNYTGGGIYPNTYNEDSTYGGGITYAPFGHYLHIYDSASGYLNDNYNPNDSSTRFAHMQDGLCTKSLTNINFNFYYLCQGSATAYGQVYYSANNGAWTQIGAPLYNNKYKWQYATITSPAFSNLDDLRFGFLWHNDQAAGTDTSAFGIDDVSIYGVYDSLNHPITCKFTTLSFDSCLGGTEYVFFKAHLSDSTCDAQWSVNMSNGNGTGSSGQAWYGYVGPDYFNDTANYWYLSLPTYFSTVGSCYKFTISRASYPYLTFTDSVCFPFDSCPGTITTYQPPATLDANPVCAGSLMDVPFVSTGEYNVYNVYIAQLIDSIGSTATIDTIGHIVNNTAYPSPFSPYGPGDIVGTIPLTAPAGCNYYVRVVSTTGNRKPFMWGPFCIQHCDIITNNQAPVQACLQACNRQPDGFNDSVSFKIHKYDSLAEYYKGNKFEVELIKYKLYPPQFTVLDTGLLGFKVDTVSGKLLLHVPCPDTLFMDGIDPGVYYVRIVADSSSFTDSAFGSLVTLSIGEPADSLFLTTGTPGPFCAGNATVFVSTNPDHSGMPYNSTYQWWITDRANGTQLFNNWSYSYLSFYVPDADTVVISCQETNNGCGSNKAVLPDTLVFIGPPSGTKTGPTSLCVTDTGTYSIPFENNTNYIWTLPQNSHADTSTNVLKIQFDATGTFPVSVLATNSCYTTVETWDITVQTKPMPVITTKPSTTICSGMTDTLSATGGANGLTYKWSTGVRTTSIKVKPTQDTSYWVDVSNRGCGIYDTVKLTVLPKPALNVAACVGDTVVMSATGAKTYSWNPSIGVTITDSIAKAILLSSQTYTVVGTGGNGCNDTTLITVDPSVKTDNVSGAVMLPSSGGATLTTTGGNSWFWSPPDGLNCDTCPSVIATPTTTTVYTVVIKNAAGCSVEDTVTVELSHTCDIFVPDAFSPDNSSNKNTILYARSECLESFDFEVFDRWGNKVFESHSPSSGWNGIYGGQPMNTGTFVYTVTGKTPDGKTLTKKGSVALVR